MTSAWLLAARPATLWAGISPVLVGSAIGIDDGAFRPDVLVAALIVAIAIQIGVNFANDVADAMRGADGADRVGPTRAVASGLISSRAMWGGIGVAFAVAAGAGIYLAVVAGPLVLLIGAVSFLAALGYTNGPMPYGYRGLGEVFVFIFFGLVATAGTRFVYDGTTTLRSWVAGVVMGFLATAILVANNVRDAETDRRSGKRTLAVLLGDRRSREFFALAVAAAYATVAIAVIAGTFDAPALLALAAVPVAAPPVRTVWSRRDGPALIGALKGTARAQLLTAVLLSAGMLV